MRNVADTLIVFFLLAFVNLNVIANNPSFVFKFDEGSEEVSFTEKDALNLQDFLYTKSVLLNCDEKEVKVIVDSRANGKQDIVDELYRKGYVVLELNCSNQEIVFTLSKTELIEVNENEVMSYEVIENEDDDYMVFQSPTYGKASPKVVKQKEGYNTYEMHKAVFEYKKTSLITKLSTGKEKKKNKEGQKEEKQNLITAKQEVKYRNDIVNEFMNHLQNDVLSMEIDFSSSASIIVDADKIENTEELVIGEQAPVKTSNSPN